MDQSNKKKDLKQAFIFMDKNIMSKLSVQYISSKMFKPVLFI